MINMVRTLLIIFIIFSLVLSINLSEYIGMYRESSKILDNERQNRERLKDTLCNMEITLVTAYPRLSGVEARYYSVIMRDMSNKYGIDWTVYPALVWVESRWNGNAQSNKGAKGLTQVLESTAEGVCSDIGVNYHRGKTLWNDILNIVIGLTYFSQGLSSGDMEHAIKRYVGGDNYPNLVRDKSYVESYYKSVWQEYKKINLIYRGTWN